MIVLSPHNGHYLYNDKIYVDRASILDDMLLNKDYFGEVSFYYNDHVFDKFDWGIPVDISLDRLYTFRAQQLRDKYKKLILSLFSLYFCLSSFNFKLNFFSIFLFFFLINFF